MAASAQPVRLFSRGPALRRQASALAFCAGLVVALLGGPAARAEVSKEYQIKAAFLYNFTKFIEWPPASFEQPDAPLVIAVLGRNPFGDEIEKAVRGRRIDGREIVVKSVATAEEARSAHLVFVCAGEEPRAARLLSASAGAETRGVLMVGESEQFAAGGGIITFTREADKVRFGINQHSAERAGLKISAQLLKLATGPQKKR